MYAIVRTGGKQYRVEEGRSFDVELLKAEEGASVELDNVLLIADDGDLTVGTPLIEGARVMADVESHGRQPKIVVFKYKSKVRTRKKTGHRQHFTRLAVTEILRPGETSKAAKPKRKTRKSSAKAASAEVADTDTAVAESATTDAAAAAPAAKVPSSEKAAPKRTRKPAARKAATTADASAPDDAADEKAPSAEKAKPKRTRKPAASKAKADSDESGAEADASAAKADVDAAKAEKKPARKRATKKADEDKE